MPCTSSEPGCCSTCRWKAARRSAGRETSHPGSPRRRTQARPPPRRNDDSRPVASPSKSILGREEAAGRGDDVAPSSGLASPDDQTRAAAKARSGSPPRTEQSPSDWPGDASHHPARRLVSNCFREASLPSFHPPSPLTDQGVAPGRVCLALWARV
ncbi:hypothetical protein CDD83_661 [Cordyceps sp. RAO-2017]|nr:hypothetical protein CDD83_661 [Cordyceps sp. RAO-2017]